jgi:hypothetical protein
MKQIEISALPNAIGDEPGEDDKYIVVRNGEELGHFLPVVKRNPAKERADAEAYHRHLAKLRANGWVDAEIIDQLERTLPRPGVIDAVAHPVATAAGGQVGGVKTANRWSSPAEASRHRHLGTDEHRTIALPERRIDINDLPEESNDTIRTGPNYAVERDGNLVGYLVPRKKRDQEAIERKLRELDRLIDQSLRNGYTREQLVEDLDLSKPFRDDL